MFSLVSHQSPWKAATVFVNMLQELLSLTLLSVVNEAFLLVVRKLLKAFRSSHSLQSAHSKRSGTICSELCESVDVDFEGLLPPKLGLTITRIHVNRVGIQQ